MGHRAFKKRVYPEFARIAQALASDKRLELLDLLAQGSRHVEALVQETEMSVASSQGSSVSASCTAAATGSFSIFSDLGAAPLCCPSAMSGSPFKFNHLAPRRPART